MTDRALSPKEIAQRYGVDVHAVTGWIRSGELKAINVGRSPNKKKPRWKITPEALAQFELSRQAVPDQLTTRIRRRRQPVDVIDRY